MDWKSTSMMCRAFSIEALVSKEKRASTSVDTLPGMIWRISLPNSTSRRSRVASTFSSRSLPCMSSKPEEAKANIDCSLDLLTCCLPYSTAMSWSFAYCSFFDAARINDGLVVASWGSYLLMAVRKGQTLPMCYAMDLRRCWRVSMGASKHTCEVT